MRVMRTRCVGCGHPWVHSRNAGIGMQNSQCLALTIFFVSLTNSTTVCAVAGSICAVCCVCISDFLCVHVCAGGYTIYVCIPALYGCVCTCLCMSLTAITQVKHTHTHTYTHTHTHTHNTHTLFWRMSDLNSLTTSVNAAQNFKRQC
jgi:hypothetical protein